MCLNVDDVAAAAAVDDHDDHDAAQWNVCARGTWAWSALNLDVRWDVNWCVVDRWYYTQ